MAEALSVSKRQAKVHTQDRGAKPQEERVAKSSYELMTDMRAKHAAEAGDRPRPSGALKVQIKSKLQS